MNIKEFMKEVERHIDDVEITYSIVRMNNKEYEEIHIKNPNGIFEIDMIQIGKYISISVDRLVYCLSEKELTEQYNKFIGLLSDYYINRDNPSWYVDDTGRLTHIYN